MKPIRFGIDLRHNRTGAELYVRIFQISSIFPILYIFTATGYAGILRERNVLSILFDLGMSALPRAWVLLLSWLYRLTSNEILVYFALLVTALALGIAADRVLIGAPDKSVRFHKICIVLILLDLLLRLVPLPFSTAFGLPAAIVGFVIRAACLWFLWMDLKA